MPFDYVLYGISYSNLILYGRVIPSFDTNKDNDGKSNRNEKVIDAEDPNNADLVRNLFLNMN